MHSPGCFLGRALAQRASFASEVLSELCVSKSLEVFRAAPWRCLLWEALSEPLIGICSPELDPHYTMSHYYLYQLSISLSLSSSYFWLPALYSGEI